MATQSNFYTNPAFCQQSEYLSHVLQPKNVRQSPIGAQCVSPHLEQGKKIEEELEEQEFYEEVLVDDKGFITDKKFVIVAQNNEGKKYIQVPQNENTHGARYGTVQSDERKGPRYEFPTPTKPTITRSQSHRYEYIPMQEQNVSPVKKAQYLESVEVSPGRYHRYAVIEAEDENEPVSQKSRYAIVPVEHLNTSIRKKQTTPVPSFSPPKNNILRHMQTPNSKSYESVQNSSHMSPPSWNYGQLSPRPNPAATQKLHEILSTPKKPINQVLSPYSSRRMIPTPVSQTRKEYCYPEQKRPPSKAQQKLNYALGARQVSHEKRHPVAPICSSPIQSICSETTFSKSGSLSVLSRRSPIQTTLTIATMIMALCGAVTSALCFYMIYLMERQYYLDFGVAAGFTCFILGILGFRSRSVFWLPNRNYISGYILLSVFSLSTCAALLVLLVKHPKKGTPMADMTSGAVCGFSVLSLILATMGLFSSYCCKFPPPDNRVQHCAEGFNV